jgi:proline iminopeptidase
MGSIFRRIGDVYSSQPGALPLIRAALAGAWRTRMRGEPLVHAGRVLCRDWSVVERLSEITVPTLVMAGEDDFVFPPECQLQLASALPKGRLRLIERAGHNPHWERPVEVMTALRSFLRATPAAVSATLTRPSRG